MEMLNDWRERHKDVIVSFLQYLNAQTDQFVLKGGTALMLCYGLNRFSEDVDLDGRKQDIKEIARRFCGIKGYSYGISKDTPTVRRCMIDYGFSEKNLKIEVSYRQKTIDPEDVVIIHGLQVYTIDRLAQLKASAYQNRDRIRDLFDLSFICKNYYDELSRSTKNVVRDAVANKGLEQFDFLLETQNDPLIDKDELASNFLEMHDRLGLLIDDDSQLIQAEDTPKPQADLKCGRRR